MKLTNFHDIQQIFLDWNHHIGSNIWKKLWFDILEYSQEVYHVVNEALDMRNLSFVMMKHSKEMREEWDMFGEKFYEMMNIGWFWDEEEKSLGVRNEVWQATIYLQSLLFYAFVLICITKGPQVMAVIAEWWKRPRKRRPSVELAEPMSFRLASANESLREEVLFEIYQGQTGESKRRVQHDETDRALMNQAMGGKTFHCGQSNDAGAQSDIKVGKVQPPALLHRIPTIRFADEPLLSDFMINQDTVVNQSFAILNECQELDSTLSTINDSEYDDPKSLRVKDSPRKSNHGRGNDEHVDTLKRPMRRQSQMNLQQLNITASSRKPKVSFDLPMVKDTQPEPSSNFEIRYSDADTVLLPENLDSTSHALVYVLDKQGNLTLRPPAEDVYNVIDKTDEASNTLFNLSQQLVESMDVEPLWTTPVQSLTSVIRPRPNLDGHVVPDISPLELSPSDGSASYFTVKKRISTSEADVAQDNLRDEDDSGENNSSEGAGLLLNLNPRISKPVSSTPSTGYEKDCETQNLVKSTRRDSSQDADQRIEKLLGRVSETNADSPISPHRTDPFKDELLDEYVENSLTGHSLIPETNVKVFGSSPDEQDLTQEEMRLFGMPRELLEKLDLPRAALDSPNLVAAIEEENARHTQMSSYFAEARPSAIIEMGAQSPANIVTEIKVDNIKSQEMNEDDSVRLDQSYEDESSGTFDLPANYIEEYHSNIVDELGRQKRFSVPLSIEEPTDLELDEHGASILDDSSMNASVLINSDMVKGKTPEKSLQRLDMLPRESKTSSKSRHLSKTLDNGTLRQRSSDASKASPSETHTNRHSRVSSTSDIMTDVYFRSPVRAKSVSPVKTPISHMIERRNVLGNASPSIMYKRMAQRQVFGTPLIENTPPERQNMNLTGEST